MSGVGAPQGGEGADNKQIVPYSGKYATNNSLRLLYGYDYNQQDRMGMSDIDTVIVSSSEFGQNEFLGQASKVNNTIYMYTYQYFFLFFAYSVGIFAAIALGIFTAAARFFIVFLCKPMMRIAYMMASVFMWGAQIWADIARPIMALIFPWNKN